MEIIPVLDLLNGVVVQGVAGNRDRYRPVSSVLTPSRDPSVIMKVIREQFSLTSFYLADLDAIQFRQLNRCTIAELSRGEASLMIDAGIRCERDVEELLELGVDQVIVGLETLPDTETAIQLLGAFDSEQLILSLDLKNGRLLTENESWCDRAPVDLAREFISIGFENLIVLDLSAVGMEKGIPTLQLCRELRNDLPGGRLITGGGFSSVDDLDSAIDADIDGILIASAIHNGRLSPKDLQRL